MFTCRNYHKNKTGPPCILLTVLFDLGWIRLLANREQRGWSVTVEKDNE